ncbi:MSMEG_1061 family FMN-dependent PPOX-type flavoprotein [Changchengzhania lutea]|uniref:MSMEG_1061 family FMN-dependent PPOX-type flavoprotein n=1 Tax=Changchengzhania lutea TaxID=2049305 RepID=UPI00115EBA8B|nr:MSMEG_1061 family FMN-dependent PPOX-type flavoprotein [Changchengzhania lutea]
MNITNANQLRDLYGFPSGRAKDKSQTKLDKHSINFINHAPFLVMSTCNKSNKMDTSPRGGAVGFVKVLNATQIIIPDAKGNNRLDSLCNILDNNSVGLLFFIPGVDETLRLNGKAQISINDDYLKHFKNDSKPPKSVIIISVEEVFLHCAKAFMRSSLWDGASKIDRSEFPTMGQIFKDQLESKEPAETREAMIKRYKKDL